MRGRTIDRLLVANDSQPVVLRDGRILVTNPPRADMSNEVPRRVPTSGNWERSLETPQWTRWFHVRSRTLVLSCVDIIREANHQGLQWHVSATQWTHDMQKRIATNEAIEMVKRDFFGEFAHLVEEDNHVAGGWVRNLWLPVKVDEQGVPCVCTATEEPRADGEYVHREPPKVGR